MLLSIIWHHGPRVRRLASSLGDYAGEMLHDSAGDLYGAIVYAGW